MSEIRVDTISEKTSANGVTIDGLTIKDGGISATTQLDVQQSTTDMVGLSILNTNNSATTTSSQLRIGMTNSVGASYAVMKVQEGGSDDYPDIIFGVQNAVTTTPTERMRIKDTGQVGIGETAPLGRLHVKTADSSSGAHANADEFVIEGSAYSGMTIASGTTSHGTIAFADSGDELAGRIIYNHSTNAMSFGTSGVGTQWSINSDGNLLPGEATSQGIHLGVTSATASNLLDDYEEGTWTIPNGAVNGITYAVSSVAGNTYTKIGRQVTINANMTFGSNTSDGNPTYLGTLPFTPLSGGSFVGKVRTSANITGCCVEINGGESFIRLMKDSGGTYDYVTRAESRDQRMEFTISYLV